VTDPTLRLVLASASPARLSTLRATGLRPEVVVSGVDESGLDHLSPAELARTLATLKAEAVAARLPEPDGPTVIVGCDSVLELDGQAYGKPGTAEVARARWRTMRGRVGVLHTGHHVICRRAGGRDSRTAGAATTVHFADLGDAEIDAYVATGEPLEVAGAFTVDGLGGPFVTRLEGDYHNVVGISLPLLRTMLLELGVSWPDLW
jgi:septum formation protein